MKISLLIVTLISAILLTCAPGCDDVRGELEDTLERYLQAVASGNGDAVLQIIDPKNIESYDRLAAIARTGQAVDILRMQPIEKYWIAVIRGGTDPKDLKNIDGRAVVKRWIAPPLTEGRELPPFSLGKIKHQAPRASGELFIDGEPSGVRFEFVRIGERWHFNSEALNELFNERVQKIMRAGDHSEEYVVLMVASRKIGKRLETSIWSEERRR
jgi:hypothetical protein